MKTRALLIVALMFAGLAGCSSDATSPATSPQTSSGVVVNPTDGQDGVRLDAGIELTFPTPADRDVVERNVHLYSERSFADSLCPDSTMVGHGDMWRMMSDPVMLQHMGQSHAVRGRFIWNDADTQCYFRPDSMMAPRMQYMIHMGGEMMDMMEQRWGSRGMMGGHGSGMMSRDMTYRFMTMDTTGTGPGHGHH